MKKLLLFLVAIAFVSCTSEPLPSNIILKDSNTASRYKIEWDSNQIEPYMDVVIRRGGVDIPVTNIVSKSYDIMLKSGDYLMIGINYKAVAPRPEVSLKISKYAGIHYESGVYEPDATYELYEQKTTANGLGFNGKVDEQGNIK